MSEQIGIFSTNIKTIKINQVEILELKNKIFLTKPQYRMEMVGKWGNWR